MIRPLTGVLALLLYATPCMAATLTGQVVNGTTGEPAHADRIEIFDVTNSSGAAAAALDDVSGSFSIEDLPDAAAAHFRLVVTSGGIQLRQSIESFDTAMDVFVYDETEVVEDIALLRHHVIFTRDPEHMQVTEYLEFDNRTSPPRIIRASSLPMRLHLDHDMHGAATASLMGGAVPVDVDIKPTDQALVSGIDYHLQPGATRLVVRYLLHEEGEALAWTTQVIYPTEERHALVNPPDVELEAADMIRTDSDVDGYTTYAGLPAVTGEEWLITLAGGSAATATDTHDHDDEANNASAFTEVVSRPNRLTDSRTLILVLLGGALLMATLAALRTGAGRVAVAADPMRAAVSKVADRYVSGEIDRAEYEREADRILKKHKGHASAHAG